MNNGGAAVKGENKRFVFVLVILLFLVVCLAVGIVLIKLNEGKGSGTDTENSIAESDEKSLEIKDEIFEICKNSIEGSDEMEQTELLIKCSDWIMAGDDDKVYSKEVLDALVRVDNVLQSVGSATIVMNAADFYDDWDLMQEYVEILNSRSDIKDNKTEGMG